MGRSAGLRPTMTPVASNKLVPATLNCAWIRALLKSWAMKREMLKVCWRAVRCPRFTICQAAKRCWKPLLSLLLLLAFVVRSSGAVVIAWGSGQGTNVPPALTNVAAIAAGSGHCLALLPDGSVAAWGDNSYFQTNVPVDVSNVVAVSAGFYHSLALKSDGSVVAWGRNTHDQSMVPDGLTNVIAIAGGGEHSVALRADGTVVYWGK